MISQFTLNAIKNNKKVYLDMRLTQFSQLHNLTDKSNNFDKRIKNNEMTRLDPYLIN